MRSDGSSMPISARNVHHVGLSVADLDASLRFYVELLGGRRLFGVEQSGPLLAAVMGVPDASLRLAFVGFGEDFVELIEYRSPRGDHIVAKPYDRACVHLALTVEDLDAACAALRRAGVDVTDPTWVTDGPTAGAGFSYCTDPDRVFVELYQTTRAVEAHRSVRSEDRDRSRAADETAPRIRP